MKKAPVKPLSIARHDFVESITELINNSMLPPCVIEAVIKDVYNEVQILSQRRLEIDMKNYSLALKEGETQDDPYIETK